METPNPDKKRFPKYIWNPNFKILPVSRDGHLFEWTKIFRTEIFWKKGVIQKKNDDGQTKRNVQRNLKIVVFKNKQIKNKKVHEQVFIVFY